VSSFRISNVLDISEMKYLFQNCRVIGVYSFISKRMDKINFIKISRFINLTSFQILKEETVKATGKSFDLN